MIQICHALALTIHRHPILAVACSDSMIDIIHITSSVGPCFFLSTEFSKL